MITPTTKNVTADKMTVPWYKTDDWYYEQPQSLRDLAAHTCTSNLNLIADYHADQELYSLKNGIVLPNQLSEQLFRSIIRKYGDQCNSVLPIFSSPDESRLQKISLRNSEVNDQVLNTLLVHRLGELDLSGCQGLTRLTRANLNRHGSELRCLRLGDSAWRVLKPAPVDDCLSCTGQTVPGGQLPPPPGEEAEYTLRCPNLQLLTVHHLNHLEWHHDITDLMCEILQPLTRLRVLDFSNSDIRIENMECLQQLHSLVKLILHGVVIEEPTDAFRVLGGIKSLRTLDLSQECNDGQSVKYSEPERHLEALVNNLPNLVHLDISATNLAGFVTPDYGLTHMHSKRKSGVQVAIPGIYDRHFEFLGLLDCDHHPCARENIPATKVSGDETEEQILVSVEAYLDHMELLCRSLSNLFNLIRSDGLNNPRRALLAVLKAMEYHLDNKHVQISGSASLFYIVKSDEKKYLKSSMRKSVITALLDAMEWHSGESTMQRNGCLTICHFRIPQDVLFDYKRLVTQLLSIVAPNNILDDFVQRVSIYLLNSLACQVDGEEKKLVGRLGAMTTMLSIIRSKVRRGVCDEIMEISWSTMWNVTDETPENCELFLRNDGIYLFLQCIEQFPDKPELLRNIMGLMGNVAEVPHLRPRLMEPYCVKTFYNLLESESDGIEVSYNACGVLAHLVCDGPEAWQETDDIAGAGSAEFPSRSEVLLRMRSQINRWNLKTKRNINYRSFEPILRLLGYRDTPEAQHWACWALCNLTKMYREKYCRLLMKEGGVEKLQVVIDDDAPYTEIKELAREVIVRCERVANANFDSAAALSEEEMDQNDDEYL